MCNGVRGPGSESLVILNEGGHPILLGGMVGTLKLAVGMDAA